MKVLIPVDGSDLALDTIKTAASLLDKQSAEVYLFTVMVPVTAEVPWGFYLATEEEGANTILNKAERVAKEAGLTVVQTGTELEQDPAFGICNYADAQGVNLIVIGSHGFQGVTKALIGSVSEAVFKKARQPVMIIRHDRVHSMEISHADQINLKSL
jgi:nucleotide-binding universal stress UspA family protein